MTTPNNIDPLNDLEHTQMNACVTLAKALAKQRIRVAVVYTPGDAPKVVTETAPGIEICADHQGLYDIWSSHPLDLLKPNLSLDQAITVLSSPLSS